MTSIGIIIISAFAVYCEHIYSRANSNFQEQRQKYVTKFGLSGFYAAIVYMYFAIDVILPLLPFVTLIHAQY